MAANCEPISPQTDFGFESLFVRILTNGRASALRDSNEFGWQACLIFGVYLLVAKKIPSSTPIKMALEAGSQYRLHIIAMMKNNSKIHHCEERHR